MDAIITSVMGILAQGKNNLEIIPIILGLIIWHLLEERKKLMADNQKKDEKIDEIIEGYHKGNMTLTEALNALRIVLYEIKARIQD